MTTLIRIGGWAVMVAALLFANVAIADHQEVCFERYDQPADGMNRTEAFNQCKAEAEITLERFKAANPDIFSPYAVVEIYKEQTATWITPLVELATIIFWTLALIEFILTFSMMAVRGSDMPEYAVEFLKRVLIISLGIWMLQNTFIFFDIVEGFQDTAAIAGGRGSGLERLATLGPTMVLKIVEGTKGLGLSNLGVIFLMLFCAVIILLAFTAVAVMLVYTLCELYIVVTVGIFTLGFFSLGFAREYTLRFFGGVIGTGFKLLALELIISLGLQMMDRWVNMPVYHDPVPYLSMFQAAIVFAGIAIFVPLFIQGLLSGAPGSGFNPVGAIMQSVAIASAGAGAAIAATKATTGGVMSIQDAAKMAKTAGATGVAGVAMGTARNLAGAKLDNIRRDSPMAAQMREARFAAQADKSMKSSKPPADT